MARDTAVAPIATEPQCVPTKKYAVLAATVVGVRIANMVDSGITVKNAAAPQYANMAERATYVVTVVAAVFVNTTKNAVTAVSAAEAHTVNMADNTIDVATVAVMGFASTTKCALVVENVVGAHIASMASIDTFARNATALASANTIIGEVAVGSAILLAICVASYLVVCILHLKVIKVVDRSSIWVAALHNFVFILKRDLNQG